MAEQSEKRYILTTEAGSVQYDIDHDNQTISLKVDIEKLSKELTSDDTFNAAISDMSDNKLSDYYTKAETTKILDEKLDEINVDVDLSNYYTKDGTKEYVDSKIYIGESEPSNPVDGMIWIMPL